MRNLGIFIIYFTYYSNETNLEDKIISEEKARTLNPDFFFVTPWGFMSEFVKREKNWLKKGGKFIVPFPKMKVVSYENKK